MKKTRRTTFLLLTALVLTWTLSFPAGALSYRKGANGASASYRAARYYAHLSKVPLTGDGRSDVLAVALSQLGYQEGSSTSQLGGTVGTSGNFTEFFS